MGASLGLALKKTNPEHVEIVGYDREPSAASAAIQRCAVDRVQSDLTSAVKGANIVIIATPVLTIREVLKEIAPALPDGCLVTDTGSTKTNVLAWAKEYLPPKVSFVGGHPMAGKEKSGVEAADAELFQGCPYCIVPPKKASSKAVRSIVSIAELVGARPFFIDASEHDRFVAAISHLPLVISAALVSATASDPEWSKMAALASSGYRDLSRLASGSPKMSRDICLTNRDALVQWIDRFIKELGRYRGLLLEGDDRVEEAFIQARKAREAWLKSRESHLKRG